MAIKGVVSAGKRRRSADDTSDYKFGDFTRGLFQAAHEVSADGAAIRGDHHQRGDLIDFTVGAKFDATEYIRSSVTKTAETALDSLDQALRKRKSGVVKEKVQS